MNKVKKVLLALSPVALVSKVMAAAPTDLDGVAASGSAHLTTAQGVALGFAILGMGWAAYKVVKRFVRT